MLAHVETMERQERELDPRISREGVRGHFAGCTFPELALAMQEIREMVEELMDSQDGRKQCLRDKAEFQKLHPGKLLS